jgi:hypothetical protein
LSAFGCKELKTGSKAIRVPPKFHIPFAVFLV